MWYLGIVGRLGVCFFLFTAVLAAGEARRLEPLTGFPEHPADNPGAPEKIKLGEMLFFEQMLSGGNRRSCSTCHKPELLFMDGLSRAWGLHDSELRLKTPGLLNVGWQRRLFFDGRVGRLEEQVAFPLKNHHEMSLNPDEAARKVSRSPVYQRMFSQVFPGEPITFDLIAKAIAAFERTLVSHDSDLDRYLLGDETALTPAARRGMDLFTGKARCVSCHHGPLLTDHQLHYTGVPESAGGTEPGKKYKTASLRDVVRRASFMHNGHYLRIDHVLDHYIRGGDAPEGTPSEITPISLSADEKRDLFQFLKALNGRVAEWRGSRDRDIFSVNPRQDTSGEKPAPVNPNYVNR